MAASAFALGAMVDGLLDVPARTPGAWWPTRSGDNATSASNIEGLPAGISTWAVGPWRVSGDDPKAPWPSLTSSRVVIAPELVCR